MEAKHTRFFYHVNPELGEQPASYGMTHLQLLELQEKQSRNTQEMIDCSEDPKIKIQKAEAEFVFLVALENPLFDERRGVRIDRGVTFQKFNLAVWAKMKKENYSPAHRTTIIHNPLKYVELLEAKKEVTSPTKPVDPKEQEALFEAEVAKKSKQNNNGK